MLLNHQASITKSILSMVLVKLQTGLCWTGLINSIQQLWRIHENGNHLFGPNLEYRTKTTDTWGLDWEQILRYQKWADITHCSKILPTAPSAHSTFNQASYLGNGGLKFTEVGVWLESSLFNTSQGSQGQDKSGWIKCKISICKYHHFNALEQGP